jgi:hypothetical protein
MSTDDVTAGPIRNPQVRPSSRFRAQFLGIAGDLTPIEVGVTDLNASEASEAMREAISMAWPPQAIGFRLLETQFPRVIAGTIPEQSAGESRATAAKDEETPRERPASPRVPRFSES